MTSHSSGNRPRRSRGGSRRRGDRDRNPRYSETRAAKPPQKKTFWQRIAAFFNGNGDSAKRPAPASRNGTQQNQSRPAGQPQQSQPQPSRERPARKPESVEVTTPRLYVGNLSFEATESDLFELFNGVGQVRLRADANGRRSEARRAGIARQGIPRPQAGREWRQDKRAFAARRLKRISR